MVAGVSKNDGSVYLKSDNSNYLWKGGYGWAVGQNYTVDFVGIKNSVSVPILILLPKISSFILV